jgi:hypothetical protein
MTGEAVAGSSGSGMNMKMALPRLRLNPGVRRAVFAILHGPAGFNVNSTPVVMVHDAGLGILSGSSGL